MADRERDRWRQIEQSVPRALSIATRPSAKSISPAPVAMTRACEMKCARCSVYQPAADDFLEQPALAEAARSLAREARPAIDGPAHLGIRHRSPSLARAAWAKCIGRAIRVSAATSPSRSSNRRSQPIRSIATASSARRSRRQH